MKKKQETESESIKFRANSPQQREAIRSIQTNAITLLIGPAGTGKTLCACFASYALLQKGEIDKIIVIRLAAESHGEKIGALPGGLREKLSYMAGPIMDNFAVFTPLPEVESFLSSPRFEIIPVSQVRGRSFRRCAVIVEEIQNLDDSMVLTILTRIGEESHMILTGDPLQVDFPGRNGVAYAKKLLLGLDSVRVINFTNEDVCRHPIIPEILLRASQISMGLL